MKLLLSHDCMLRRVFAWQAASAPPEVAMGRSLEHLAHLCATHEAKIAELTEQVRPDILIPSS